MKKNKYKKRGNSSDLLVGIVDHVKKNFCFVSVNGLNEDIKVSINNMNGAIHGDKVELKISHHLTRRNIEGKIIKIIERNKNEFIGRVEDSQEFAFFIPKNKKIYTDFFINKKRNEKK